VVVGGGDSALDWALMLEPIAKSVTLVHRRAQFRAHPHSVDLMTASSVEVLVNAQIAGVRGDPDISEVDIDVAGELRTLPCEKLVAALGFTANLGPLAEWGVELRKRCIKVDSTGRTTVPGIYAAGDIVDYEGKVKLIATGFGEVATAVNNAAAWLDPSVSAFPGHLSDYAPADGGTPTAQ
jgi:thioredoxin reductase (NADPH)